jgi:RimJ/RimL family protein N-acetyltransferase
MVTDDWTVTLRPWCGDDADAMIAIFDDVEVDRWTPLPYPFTIEHALKRIRTGERLRPGQHLRQLAIVADGTVAGEVSAFPADSDVGAVEVAYVVAGPFRRRGFARQALRLLLPDLEQDWGVRRFVAMISPSNPASAAVARAAGFRRQPVSPVIRERKGRRVHLETWLLDQQAAVQDDDH